MNVDREEMRLILTKQSMSNRAIGKCVGRSPNTVKKDRAILVELNLDWEQFQKLDDNQIRALLRKPRGKASGKREPDMLYTHSQMLEPDVTGQLLWEEYAMDDPSSAYGYSSFMHQYRKYKKSLGLAMRQTHKAGEVVFVDFAGRGIPYHPPGKPEQVAEIFVGVLGASKLTFAWACESQKLPDWLDAHNRMYWFFGGVPQLTEPDNLRSAVIKSGPEPTINRSYQEMAAHYGTVIVPARVKRPQDKSLAEIGVQMVTRWITVKLRKRRFFPSRRSTMLSLASWKHSIKNPSRNFPGRAENSSSRLRGRICHPCQLPFMNRAQRGYRGKL